MKTTRHKTPAGYVAPLKSRAVIVAWLLERAKANPRKNYGLFTYSVKLHSLNTDFAHLCKLARESGELAADASPRYLAAVEAVYKDKERTIWEDAEDSARRSVTDDDSNRMHWDGDGPVAEWTFDGRSGGWLVLEEFDAIKLSGRNSVDAEYISTPPADGGPSYNWLRNLYRFLIQCDHDFRRPESEVEHQAAFTLFANFCSEVETDEQAAKREAAERAEAAERLHWEARDTVTV